ncbi:hypothetical protein EN829_049865 [Mesorhizobium sp. M00.F.Ca.ET.186.01.1.1]|nr:hypothetical protein EN829_049865 [Mesorhizobium sp. M00.F.Ca.ET.186.01.1.1]
MQEMECVNQKADLAAVVGNPALSTDDVATIIMKLQNAKNTLAANITAQGQVASGNDNLASLAAKVIATPVKRWARGTASYNGGRVTVSGLSFKPNFVLMYVNQNNFGFFYSEATSLGYFTAYNTGSQNVNYFVLDTLNKINSDGWTLDMRFPNLTVVWLAFE